MGGIPTFLINSKGRAGKTTTDKLLDSIHVDYSFIVEPCEEEAYSEKLSKYGSVITLPENGRGLPYSRNFAKEIASKNHEYFVLLDDDIRSFYRFENGKTIKTSPHVILDTLEWFKNSGLALVSYEYVQFAWSQKKKFSEMKPCDCCVFFNSEMTADVHYDESFKLKSDRDFCMQLAFLGRKFGRINSVGIDVPPLGSVRGGLYQLYKDKEDEKYAIRLFRKWGGKICKLIRKKNGRLDCKMDFKKMVQHV